MSAKWEKAGAKALAAYGYISLHRKQLSAAIALGAGLLEAVQRAH